MGGGYTNKRKVTRHNRAQNIPLKGFCPAPMFRVTPRELCAGNDPKKSNVIQFLSCAVRSTQTRWICKMR